jgi:hypothetical protein
MNYVYDELLRKMCAALADIFVMRAVEMSEAIDEIIRLGIDPVDVPGMRTAYHRATTKEVRKEGTFRIVLTNMGRDETDPPPSGTFLKVANYQEVAANTLGPAYVNARQAALKIRGTTAKHYVEIEDFVFEKFVSTGKTLALVARWDISMTADTAFLNALLAMYYQRPKES